MQLFVAAINSKWQFKYTMYLRIKNAFSFCSKTPPLSEFLAMFMRLVICAANANLDSICPHSTYNIPPVYFLVLIQDLSCKFQSASMILVLSIFKTNVLFEIPA